MTSVAGSRRSRLNRGLPHQILLVRCARETAFDPVAYPPETPSLAPLVTSRDNQGDYPTLPRQTGTAPEFIAGRAGSSDASGGEHVLVVDDEASIRLSLHRFLTRLGYRVSIARNGCEALATLSETRVDLVITDLVMPDYDGRQLIEQMRADYPTMPVLVISGFPAALLPDPGPDGKPVPFLAKPFALDTLASEVHRLLQERASQSRG